LSVMLGAVDVLASNPQSAASLRAIDRIRRACGEMLAFIEATLFMSREEAMQIDQEVPAALDTIVERLLEDNARWIQDRDIQVHTDYRASPVINAPASLLQITVSNLLRNAIEHTEHGSLQ